MDNFITSISWCEATLYWCIITRHLRWVISLQKGKKKENAERVQQCPLLQPLRMHLLAESVHIDNYKVNLVTPAITCREVWCVVTFVVTAYCSRLVVYCQKHLFDLDWWAPVHKMTKKVNDCIETQSQYSSNIHSSLVRISNIISTGSIHGLVCQSGATVWIRQSWARVRSKPVHGHNRGILKATWARTLQRDGEEVK